MSDPFKTLAEQNDLRKAAIFQKFAKETEGEPLVMAEDEFNKAVVSERLESFTPDSLNAYKVNLRKAYDKNEIDAAGLEKAEQELNGLATVIIEKGDLKLTRFVRRREGIIEKANEEEVSENAEEETVEKAEANLPEASLYQYL